mgnify:CR=1 FL=1
MYYGIKKKIEPVNKFFPPYIYVYTSEMSINYLFQRFLMMPDIKVNEKN